MKFEYPLQRSLVIENNYVKMSNPNSYSKMTQEYPSYFHDSGQFYFFRVDSFMKRDRLLSDKSLPIILSNLKVQDIDTEEDWKLAELKYKYIEKIKQLTK